MVHVRFDLSVPSWVVVCSLIRDSLSFCPFHFGGLSLSFLCLLSGFSFLLNLVGPSVCFGMFIEFQRLDDLVENTPSRLIMNGVIVPLFHHTWLSVLLFRLFVLAVYLSLGSVLGACLTVLCVCCAFVSVYISGLHVKLVCLLIVDLVVGRATCYVFVLFCFFLLSCSCVIIVVVVLLLSL